MTKDDDGKVGALSWPRGRQRGGIGLVTRGREGERRGEERNRCVEVGATTRRQMGVSRLFDLSGNMTWTQISMYPKN